MEHNHEHQEELQADAAFYITPPFDVLLRGSEDMPLGLYHLHQHRLERFIHERELKRSPYKATWQGGKFSLIPDAFLVFLVAMPDGRRRRMPIVLEHERGTEEQQYFRQRIKAYLIMLRQEGYKQMFGVGGITIAFTTSVGVERLKKIREWTKAELETAGEMVSFGNLFYFTLVGETIEPKELWLEKCWVPLGSNQPVALLGV